MKVTSHQDKKMKRGDKKHEVCYTNSRRCLRYTFYLDVKNVPLRRVTTNKG